VFSFLSYLTFAFALPGESRPSTIKNKKTSINFIYPNLWAPTAYNKVWLSCSSAFTRWKFRHVCEIKKGLVQLGLV